MKTFTTSFAAIIFALSILTSCGAEEKDTDTKESAQDIDVTKLEEACDFADAFLTVMEEMEQLLGDDHDDYDDLKGDDKIMGEKLKKKNSEITDAMLEDVDYDGLIVLLAAIAACDSQEKRDELVAKRGEFFLYGRGD